MFLITRASVITSTGYRTVRTYMWTVDKTYGRPRKRGGGQPFAWKINYYVQA